MIKQIVGGAIVLVVGGTTVAVSKSDVADNFSKNAGVSQQQAQQYVNGVKKSDLESFSTIGQSFISDGNTIQGDVTKVDCDNYTYDWETSALTCTDGKNQLQSISNDEIILGNCYVALDADLGDSAKAKTNECISDIDTVDSDLNLPIATAILDSKTISDETNSNIYNKSVLQAALKSD